MECQEEPVAYEIDPRVWEEINQYPIGTWVAFTNADGILSSNDSAGEAVRAARSKGTETPILTRVFDPDKYYFF